jgi:hypothetical protein
MTVCLAFVVGCLFAGYRYYTQPSKGMPAPGPMDRPTASASSLPYPRCGARFHLTGTVSSRVTPASYAVIDHVDGDLTHVTNVRTTTTDALPQAGDQVEVWGVVECDGPRDHVVEARRQVKEMIGGRK